MTNSIALVPVFSGTINSQSVQLCDARALHAFMAVLRDFSNWIKGRIRKFGFVNGVDFISISRSPELASGNRGASIDYHLTLDMAKELAMVENNPKGREARRYFIDCEKRALAMPAVPYAVAPDQTISAAQADILRDLLASFAKNMPADMRGQILREGWGKLKSHFKTDYRHIPAAQFTEAISIISRHAVEWGPRAPSQKALAPVSTTALQLMLITTCNGQPTVEMLPASDLPQLIVHQDSPFSADEALKIAAHANMRMTNETGRLARTREAERTKEAVLAMDAGDLAEIAKSAWLELAYRAAGPGAGMAATA